VGNPEFLPFCNPQTRAVLAQRRGMLETPHSHKQGESQPPPPKIKYIYACKNPQTNQPNSPTPNRTTRTLRVKVIFPSSFSDRDPGRGWALPGSAQHHPAAATFLALPGSRSASVPRPPAPAAPPKPSASGGAINPTQNQADFLIDV